MMTAEAASLSYEASEYVFARSWRARRSRERTRRVVRRGVLYLATAPADMNAAELREYLKGCLLVGDERVGNPLVIWFFLQVVLPIVIRLLVEWWLSRRSSV